MNNVRINIWLKKGTSFDIFSIFEIFEYLQKNILSNNLSFR